MLDIKFVRANPDLVKKNNEERGATKKADVDELLKLDKQRLEKVRELEENRKKRNELGNKMKAGTKPDESVIKEGRELKEKIAEIEKILQPLEKQINEILLWFPNLSSPDMPDGKTSEENIEVKAWRPDEGYLDKERLGKGEFSSKYMPKGVLHSKDEFKLKDHVELGESLGIIDIEQSAKVSGSRFCYLLKDAVKLQLALQFFLTKKLLEEGFVPMIPPTLVKENALYGSSHFPGDADQVYSISSDKVEDNNKLYLIGSSEPSNFAYFMDKTLKEDDLPYKMFATTTCFRSEVGSWGKDVRGIKRVHQFDKLEMDVVCTETQSDVIHEQLLSINEWVLQQLKLPYHVINMCKGDAGYYATYKKYDIEAWLPSQQKYMELMSDTNAQDFQARRLNAKYKTKEGESKYLHTVNDTGIAFGRMIISILDNYQQKDGTVVIPEVLRDFMGKNKIDVS